MSSKRFGEILGKIVPLSGHDIEEILSEQASSRKRFGDIALAMGLCRPEHVWKATGRQLDEGPFMIDLDAFGVDAQALDHIPAKTARALGVVPVRILGAELLVAAHDGSLITAGEALPVILERRIKLVVAPREQIERALVRYYPRESSLH